MVFLNMINIAARADTTPQGQDPMVFHTGSFQLQGQDKAFKTGMINRQPVLFLADNTAMLTRSLEF